MIGCESVRARSGCIPIAYLGESENQPGGGRDEDSDWTPSIPRLD